MLKATQFITIGLSTEDMYLNLSKASPKKDLGSGQIRIQPFLPQLPL